MGIGGIGFSMLALARDLGDEDRSLMNRLVHYDLGCTAGGRCDAPSAWQASSASPDFEQMSVVQRNR